MMQNLRYAEEKRGKIVHYSEYHFVWKWRALVILFLDDICGCDIFV